MKGTGLPLAEEPAAFYADPVSRFADVRAGYEPNGARDGRTIWARDRRSLVAAVGTGRRPSWAPQTELRAGGVESRR